jgi:hypothetical protein
LFPAPLNNSFVFVVELTSTPPASNTFTAEVSPRDDAAIKSSVDMAANSLNWGRSEYTAPGLSTKILNQIGTSASRIPAFSKRHCEQEKPAKMTAQYMSSSLLFRLLGS